MRVALILFATWFCFTAEAQLSGFGSAELSRYTSNSPFARGPDGRPEVPKYWLRQLERLSVADVVAVLAEAGYRHQFEDGWKLTNPGSKLIGRAFTVQFMPFRPDVDTLIESEAAAAGRHAHGTHRVIEQVSHGDVVVADVMGRIAKGQFGGENLILGLFLASDNGFVVDGSFRDLDGVATLGSPVYSRGFHPGVRGDAMLTGINVPIRIGGATVMPGDVVFGDRSGVVFIPPDQISRVAARLGNQALQDAVDQGVFQ